MKKILFFSFLLISMTAFPQKDSTLIKFYYLNNKDLSIICELNNIQYIGISCSDLSMRGKKFLLSFDEYENGKKIKEDTTGLTCKSIKIPFIIGKDTIDYTFNDCKEAIFSEKDSVYKITFAGKLDKDTFKLVIAYSNGAESYKRFLGNANYSLRTVICTPNNEVKIKLNTLTPILAYTLPFDIENTGSSYSIGSYCILGMENVDTWHTKFKVKHYYIINLKIE